MRMNVPGGSEENYLEAAAAVFKNVREAEVSSDTEAVLTDSRCTNPGADVCVHVYGTGNLSLIEC